MLRFILITLLWLRGLSGLAQIDTITPGTLRVLRAAWHDTNATYAVFVEDSTGKRLSSADLWDRRLRRSGPDEYEFVWSWYRRDSLLAHVRATGQWPTMAPLTHDAVYARRPPRHFRFQGDKVTIPDPFRRTASDSSFGVRMQPAAFEFPMDLELLALLPFRRVGQRFAMAFYEPGSPASAYYGLRITGRQKLSLPGQARLRCWVLRLDYAPGSFATFWISDKPREVIKMREYFRGQYRYKVKLY